MTGNIAIIPARGGSKRLPGKNIKILNGKPLIQWSIDAALQSELFDRIIVSTDSIDIKNVAEKAGAEVPYLRSAELSSDTANTDDVVKDVVLWLETHGCQISTITILQPTSPLRTASNIIDAFKLMQLKKAKAIISVCPLEHPIQYCNTLPDDLSLAGFINNKNLKRTQDLPQYYRLNGAIYLFKRSYVSSFRDIYSEGTYAYIMSKDQSIDIDEEIDFEFAQLLMAKRTA
ncbi:acylneuraminate cytidylyltransferase family protein [Cronobacter malonaticus]|uniref:Lea7 n=1 Tax=Cronobacter turicensis TaxID=413502 RepID=I7EGV9_9ENTR|nr:Lea7 [Cronobacter turicensis]